jgi:hypothetical protein
VFCGKKRAPLIHKKIIGVYGRVGRECHWHWHIMQSENLTNPSPALPAGKVNLTKLVRIKTIMSTFVCGRCAMSCATMQTLGGHFKYYQAVQSKRRRGDAVLDA